MLTPAALALDSNGNAYSWGGNHYGRLGHGDMRVRKLPSLILSLKKKTLSKIAMGGDFSVILGKDVRLSQESNTTSLASLAIGNNSSTSLATAANRRLPFDLGILKKIQKKA